MREMSKTKILIIVLVLVGIAVMIAGASIGFYWEPKEELYYQQDQVVPSTRTVHSYPFVFEGLNVAIIGGIIEIAAAMLGYFKKEVSEPQSTNANTKNNPLTTANS
jgi:flagellar basal body-associated protein FliL